jgi:hypothetical protein
MDIVNKRQVKGGNGNAASDFHDIIEAAGSWQYGAAASVDAIEAESKEENLAFGTPDSTREHIRGNPSGMDKIDNPHNFSSNPGFMSTGQMLGASMPARGGSTSDFARGSLPRSGGPDSRPSRGPFGRG